MKFNLINKDDVVMVGRVAKKQLICKMSHSRGSKENQKLNSFIFITIYFLFIKK